MPCPLRGRFLPELPGMRMFLYTAMVVKGFSGWAGGRPVTWVHKLLRDSLRLVRPIEHLARVSGLAIRRMQVKPLDQIHP